MRIGRTGTPPTSSTNGTASSRPHEQRLCDDRHRRQVLAVEGRPTVPAGDGFLIPPRTPHNARDLGPETGRMLSTYIVEQGQPLASFVGQHVEK